MGERYFSPRGTYPAVTRLSNAMYKVCGNICGVYVSGYGQGRACVCVFVCDVTRLSLIVSISFISVEILAIEFGGELDKSRASPAVFLEPNSSPDAKE
ncbi:hypothetical protein EVAR_50063_1 [Eumeta japonica]|uniref:Uncharacterized protein n=1 Tax=Eumeta variegata TaxID=151549 RepID=A0A4C1XJG0_EUMVA|nr:hypothetical protein EVAR_50063_1 [Eumeta japonica]